MSKVYYDIDDLKEIRNSGTLDASSKEIQGYAIVWDSWSVDLGGFVERIMPEAIPQHFLNEQDVVALWQHNDNTGVLARFFKNQRGTLKLTIDDTGLYYSFPIKRNSPLHQEVYEMVKSGEVFSSSFGFVVDESKEDWQKRGDGIYERTITGFKKLLDVSPVIRPAYQASTCKTRFYNENIKPNLDEYQGLNLNPIATVQILDKFEEAQQRAKEKAEAFREYYDELLLRYMPDHWTLQAKVDEALRKHRQEKSEQNNYRGKKN